MTFRNKEYLQCISICSIFLFCRFIFLRRTAAERDYQLVLSNETMFQSGTDGFKNTNQKGRYHQKERSLASSLLTKP